MLTTLHRNPYWSVKRASSGPDAHYFVDAADSVLVIAESVDGDVLLIEHWRIPHQRHVLEFPGGGIDSGELPRDAASRELLEETGVTALDLRELPLLRPATSLSTEVCHVFVARVDRFGPLEGDEGAVLTLHRNDVLEQLVRDGDAVAIAAWTLFQRSGNR